MAEYSPFLQGQERRRSAEIVPRSVPGDCAAQLRAHREAPSPRPLSRERE
jgi:hypothetical protein